MFDEPTRLLNGSSNLWQALLDLFLPSKIENSYEEKDTFYCTPIGVVDEL